MPRISPECIMQASRVDRRLPFLLRENSGSIEQAQTELRWLESELNSKKLVNTACLQRHKHVPLQYLLKSQPFGKLTIKTSPGVLIPRWETEEWCMDLISRLPHENMKSMDLCSGSGCIALSICYERPCFDVYCVDVSSRAFRLIQENSRTLLRGSKNFKALQADILDGAPDIYPETHFDIITCNPPYIPAKQFTKDCTTSVKLYEPKQALIGDLEFYDNLNKFWIGRTDSFVYEVGDISQCSHVLGYLSSSQDWEVGMKFDSNNKVRCIYGYRLSNTKNFDYRSIFRGFGKIMSS